MFTMAGHQQGREQKPCHVHLKSPLNLIEEWPNKKASILKMGLFADV